MPTFVPCLDTLELSLQFAQSDGSFAENVLFALKGSAWNNTEINDMIAGLVTWFGTGDGTHSYQDIVANDTSLVAVGYRDLTTIASASGVSNAGLPLVGTNAGATDTLGVTFTITHRTGLAGRSFRGRTYLVGIPAGVGTSPNVVDGPTYADPAVDAFGSLITAIPGAVAGSEWVVCSRYHANPLPPPVGSVPRAAGVMTPITSVGYHDLFMDFQRRRAPAHNRHH
jgi:hypothetical protein